MAGSKVDPLFCDECGATLSTGCVCPECKRVLCHVHYFGERMGPRRRKDGLCTRCAGAESLRDEKAQQA